MLKGSACDVVHERHIPVKDEFSGQTSPGRLKVFHRNMMGDPMCGHLRACVIHNRLRAWWKGLWGNWRGSDRLYTVGNRLLLIVTFSINGHCWRYHVHPWKWVSGSQSGVYPWGLHRDRRRRTNVGGVVLFGSYGRHGLTGFFVGALWQWWIPGTLVVHRPKTSRRALIAQSCVSQI